MNLTASTSPKPLEIRLLGAFELKVNGELREKVPAAVQALLALLILNTRSPLQRQTLAGILWPEATGDQASFYLRRALSQLRAILGEENLRIGSDLSVDLGNCQCDLRDFENQIETGPEEAIATYAGPLAVGKRNHRLERIRLDLAEKYAAALLSVAEAREAEGDHASAVRIVRQLVAEDRMSEVYWRSLIRLLGIQRDHVGAARAFRQLRLALREETGMEPSEETTRLYRQVMAESDVLRVRPTDVAKPALRSPRLPTPLTGIIGREEDLASVRAALAERRLVLVVGLGGVGKTRLAIEIAETWSPSASVSVARAHDADELHSILSADHLFHAEAATGAKRLLLIDNAENVLEPLRAAVEQLLTDDPDLTILVTSRRSVSWPDALVHHLAPLAIETEAPVAELSESPAIKLFVERARAADSEFTLSARVVPVVASICKKLDGLPLAIELAAAKVQSMTASEIDRRLQDRFALLGRRTSGQTLETVLAWSYEELSESERALFLDVVQLPGSWSSEACPAVMGSADFADMESLVSLDLVNFQGGRYRCLQTVREYGIRFGLPYGGLVERLAAFIFAEVEAHFSALEASTDGAVFEWFAQEEPNITWLLREAIQSGDAELRRQTLNLFSQLHWYWIRSGRSTLGYRIGEALTSQGLEPSEELTGALFSIAGLAQHAGRLELAGNSLARADAMAKELRLNSWHGQSLLMQADILGGQARVSEAISLLIEALTDFEASGDLRSQASCLRSLGYAERERGRYPESIELTRRGLKIYTEMGESAGRLWCMGALGGTWLQAGDPAQAAPYFTENAAIAKEGGDVSTTIWNLTMLGETYKQLGNNQAAAEYVREALTLFGPDQDSAALEWPTSLLGEILTNLGDFVAADQALERAWHCHSLSGFSKLGVYTMLRRADLHRRWGRFESARTYLAIAEEIAQASEVEDVSIRLEVVRAELAADEKARAQKGPL